MMLITKEIEQAFERQGYTGEKKTEDIKIICKLFAPTGRATWYLYEKETDDIYRGFVIINDPAFAECGTVSLNELKNLRLPLGLGIERDINFPIGKHSLQYVIDKIKAGGHV